MTRIVFPTDPAVLDVETYSEGIEHDVVMTATRNGRITTYTLPGARWRAKMTIATSTRTNSFMRGRAESLVAKLRGGGNTLAMFNPVHANLGTLGNTTVKTAAAARATAVVLNATNGLTLYEGDRIGFESTGQRCMVVQNTSAASGQITAIIVPELQAPLSVGDVVTLIKPTTDYVLTEPLVWMDYAGQRGMPLSLDLVEV